MSETNCELCGSRVRVVGKTTLQYAQMATKKDGNFDMSHENGTNLQSDLPENRTNPESIPVQDESQFNGYYHDTAMSYEVYRWLKAVEDLAYRDNETTWKQYAEHLERRLANRESIPAQDEKSLEEKIMRILGYTSVDLKHKETWEVTDLIERGKDIWREALANRESDEDHLYNKYQFAKAANERNLDRIRELERQLSLPKVPQPEEIRALNQRVLDAEAERDALKAELERLKAKPLPSCTHGVSWWDRCFSCKSETAGENGP